jgi:hypothetical protein
MATPFSIRLIHSRFNPTRRLSDSREEKYRHLPFIAPFFQELSKLLSATKHRSVHISLQPHDKHPSHTPSSSSSATMAINIYRLALFSALSISVLASPYPRPEPLSQDLISSSTDALVARHEHRGGNGGGNGGRNGGQWRKKGSNKKGKKPCNKNKNKGNQGNNLVVAVDENEIDLAAGNDANTLPDLNANANGAVGTGVVEPTETVETTPTDASTTPSPVGKPPAASSSVAARPQAVTEDEEATVNTDTTTTNTGTGEKAPVVEPIDDTTQV